MSRRDRDLADALRWGLTTDEAVAYADRVAAYDRNSLRLNHLAVEAGLDTRAAMLARIDAVIADLCVQLGAELVPWP